MARANYTYSIEHHAGRNVIVIEDQNAGHTSVTNDIENVVAEIARKENIDADRFMIVYKDSTGVWDGFKNVSQSFVSLNASGWKEAVLVYINIQLK